MSSPPRQQARSSPPPPQQGGDGERVPRLPYWRSETHWSPLKCKNLKNSDSLFKRGASVHVASQGISNKWCLIFSEIPAGRERAKQKEKKPAKRDTLILA